MAFIEQMKRIYACELPRPHHLVLSPARYEELVRSLPVPDKPRVPALSDLSVELYICVGEIPADEIHFVNRSGQTYKVARITA